MARKRFAIIDFSDYTEVELPPIVQIIINQLTLNALTFTTLPVAVATITASLATYTTILGAAIYPGKADDLAAARTVLEDQLRDNGVEVNVVADGDVTILDKSGYPLSKEHEAHGPLLRPTMIVESLEGSFNFRIAPDGPVEGHTTVPGARGYLVLYVEMVTGQSPPEDYHQWTWAFFPKAAGTLPALKRRTTYVLVCTALGTHPTLVFSFPIDRTTQ